MKMLELKVAMRRTLPHLYGQKHYNWSREFYETTNKMALLTAANQIGKSTVQIRKCLEWATNRTMWPMLWPDHIPRQFWYLYPTKEVATLEWKTKWAPLMPSKDHPVYGWKEKIVNGKIDSVEFNTGIILVFKVYTQDVSHLQTGTCAAIFCDEELPYDLYEELMFRLSASDGYFSMVFTATLGQEFWRLAMEPKEGEKPRFPDAWKRSVSMFDCLVFEDGTPSHWTEEKIGRVIAKCGTEAEVQKRVMGRFVAAEGRRYPSFEASSNLISPKKIPPGYKRFAGIDSGAGGETCDPAAIVFVAVSPDMREGFVYKAWRGDGILTTASDIIMKFLELRGDEEMEMVIYDYEDKDLHTIAERMGMGFVKADKGVERGEGILNALFKNKFLYLFNEGEVGKLVQELSSLMVGQKKGLDHLIDALRYLCAMVHWDWSAVQPVKVVPAKPQLPLDVRLRRGEVVDEPGEFDEIEAQFDEFNELCGS